MDYRFTDAWADPPGQTERWHTEVLTRLPHGFLCYAPRAEADIPVAPPPVRKTGYITFGSFNNLSKITPGVVALWSRILHAVPGSRLLIKNKPLQDQAVRAHYHALFAQHGVPRERVELVGWMPSPGSHLALYGGIDIALDTFPYNGTTTTCEALWMGVPVIALAGRLHASRVGVSLLARLGLHELVAESEDAYVALASRLANDEAGRKVLRAELRDRMRRSSLCDGKSFARDVEDAYRTMWRKWCAGRS
jgi:predicted O-linked N-acetylglucosamine transferase (SPINDLY family)